MNELVLLIGGNMGDRFSYLEKCVSMISKELGEVIRLSSIYETAPWGSVNQQDYLNRAVLVKTNLSPIEVLNKCQLIENQLDRARSVRWGERTMDLDIIFYNDLIIQTKNLEVPHPRYHLRNFVLIPLNEIIPNKICPEFQISIAELKNKSKDQLIVSCLEAIHTTS
jgi:2-amino-4-hydroxy-6-hydroxymethyldihydropteridine diphosphokinase